LSTVAADEIIVKAAKRAKDIRRTHELISHVEPDLPKMAVDTRAIVEAVYNLIDNAAKYSGAGTPIAISAKSVDGKVRFSIEDQGPESPGLNAKPYFQRFHRGGDASGQKQGMGMGLAIVRGIIEAHGGEIWVESGAKGARFVFDLPAGNDGREKEDTGRR
jgi:two-component system sensor histidine kinase KdpD